MTALITGASRGIGEQIATLFAQNGYCVAINYSSSKEQAVSLEQKLVKCGYSAKAFCADVSDAQAVKQMLQEIEGTMGKVEVLVNNAGIAQQKLFCDITESDFNRMFDVNVKGVFNCCKAVLPSMISEKRGSIINISSMWGQVGASCEVHYSASKAAVVGLTKALAKEVGPSNIRVNCICPGVIDTQMNASLDVSTVQQLREETPLGIIGTPNDIAQLALFLSGEKARFITGQVIGVNGGMVI
ncbi:MAG: SDR family oxidoreductase [Erysipelotrichia bacterium]|nr:SDR family oxidoreductase [Erysipelotrichia bacterium]